MSNMLTICRAAFDALFENGMTVPRRDEVA